LKISICILLTILILCFSSCALKPDKNELNQESEQTESDDVISNEVIEYMKFSYQISLGSSIEGEIFKESAQSRDIDDFCEECDDEAAKIKSIKLGVEEYAVEYQTDRIFGTGDLWHIYQTESGKQIQLLKGTDSFRIIGSLKHPIAVCEQKLTDEAQYKELVQKYLYKLIPSLDLSSYTYFAKTTVQVTGKNSLANVQYEGFYISNKEEETVYQYLFSYVIMKGEYATANRINVYVYPSGDIDLVSYINYNADWESVQIDESRINSAVCNFLNNNINSLNYQKTSYDVKSKTLIINDNKIKLMITVEITLFVNSGNSAESGDEFVVRCSLILN